LVLGLGAGAQSAFAWDVSNCITLTPPTATNQLPQQSSHTVTATVTTTYDPVGHPNITDQSNPDYWDHRNQAVYWFANEFYAGQSELPYPDICSGPGASSLVPAVGRTVNFAVTSGPNAGKTGSGVTDNNGQVTFTWSSVAAGTDVVTATDATNTTSVELIDSSGEAYTTAMATNTCGNNYADVSNCPTANKTWLPPIITPPVTGAGVPDATMTVAKRCQTRKFKISSAYSGGTVTKIVLQVDGKTKKTLKVNGSSNSGAKKFTVDSGKYAAGTHKIKLTTYFSNGSKVVKNGKFKRCAVRTTARRISPNFTG
jgi:hypothetical protein